MSFANSFQRIHWWEVIVVAIALWGMWMRFDQRLSTGGLSGDEANVIDLMQLPLDQVLRNQLAIVQFPLDYLLVWPFYRIFGSQNVVGLAVPHIILTFWGFVALYYLCRQFLKNTWAYVITFLAVSLNHNLIYHAFEIRPYSGLVTLSIVSLLLMKYVIEETNPSFQRRFWISVFILFAILFHLYGVLILLFPYVFYFICFRKEGMAAVLKRNFIHYGWGVVIALPLWLYFVFGFDRSYMVNMSMDTFQYIKKGVVPLTKGIIGNLQGFKPLYILLPGAALALILPHAERRKQIIFLVCLIVLPMAFIFWTCVTHHYWFIQRLFVWVMPWYALFLGWTWESLIGYVKNSYSR